MTRRAIAIAGVLVLVGCKDEPPKPVTYANPRLPPVEGLRDGAPAAVGSGSGSGASLPPAGSGGISLPIDSTGSGSATVAGSGSGSATATGSGSATATGSGSATAAGSATSAGSATGSGSGSGGSGSNGTTAARADCDVTIAIAETSLSWTGGVAGSIAIEGGHAATRRLTDSVDPLDDSKCRVVFRVDPAVHYSAVIAAMEAVVVTRSFRMSIEVDGGGRMLATPPSSGAAGTAVRDARSIAIGKRDIKVGDQVALTVDDAAIATKVTQALAAIQSGTRAIMVIVKAEPGTPYKVLGAVLAGAKASGIDSVIFL